MTILVTGHRKGGTSAVAGVLRILGADMGVGLAEVQEDQELVRSWACRYRKLDRTAIVRDASAALRARADWPQPWGWKDPLAVLYAAAVRVPDPRLVLVFRDPAAIAHRAGSTTTIGAILEHYQQCLEIERTWSCPTLHVSYERMCKEPRPVVLSLITLCELSVTEEQTDNACKFVNPAKGYQDVRPFLTEEIERRQR
jgi:hypothetical protein